MQVEYTEGRYLRSVLAYICETRFTTDQDYGPQFLLQPIALCALPITQQFTTYLSPIDYLTDVISWINLRNGISATVTRSIRNGREIAPGRTLTLWSRRTCMRCCGYSDHRGTINSLL
jgi:hypothetical protein